jgi:hypothetical protein
MVVNDFARDRSDAVTSAVPQSKELNAEAVMTMTTAFLKRLRHNGGLKPKRVSLEGEVYTVEVETKKNSPLLFALARGCVKLKNMMCNLKAKKVLFHFLPSFF